jgi:hypothetical protein
MNKIISFVWNSFDNDDRVKKKIETLSKKNKCLVYSVPRPMHYKQAFKQVSNNIQVKYIKTKNLIDWIAKRIFFNERFWSKNIDPKDLTDDTIIIDCNDPDTLYASKILTNKYKVGYKTIYDAHEYHTDNFVPYPGLFGYYSKVASHCHRFREKKYCYLAHTMIVVSEGIKQMVMQDKLTEQPIHVIPNLAKKYDYNKNTKKERIATFVGAHARNGLERVITILQDLNYKIIHIGNIPKKILPNVTYLGHIPKKEYMKQLEKSEIGILYYDSPNKSFKYSYPNKLSDYLQTHNIVISCYELRNITDIINKYQVGFSVPQEINQNNYEQIKSVITKNINRIKKNNKCNHSFEKCNEILNWEAQEKKLLKIYKF